MKNVTIVKDTRQASKEDLMRLAGYINLLIGAYTYLEGFYFKDILKRCPIAILVLVEENNGNIESLKMLGTEIMAQ